MQIRHSLPTADRRAWLAAAAALTLAYALYVGRGVGYPIPLVLLAASVAAAGLAVFSRRAPTLPWPRDLNRILGYGLAIQFALLAVWPFSNLLPLTSAADYLPFWIGIGIGFVIAVGAFFGLRTPSWRRLLALVAVHFAIGIWVIVQARDPYIDLWVMQREGALALVEGINPYLPIYPNLYGPNSPYYGPGIVVDGELTIGFPYPPLSLLTVLPAQLLAGDPRYAHLLAIELGALAMALIRPGGTATGAALLYLFTPWTFFFIAGSWTEPLVVLLVAVVALVAVRAPRLLGIALGLLIGIKQYMLLALPLALLLLAKDRNARIRLAWQSVLVAAVVTVPFIVWDPRAFAWSTLGSLATQVFRPDSMTFLTLLPGEWGPRLSVLGFGLLAAGLVVAWRRAPGGASGFAASLGFLLLVFFAFSRQGSANYHFAVIGALCCAVAAVDWRCRPAPSGDPVRASDGHGIEDVPQRGLEGATRLPAERSEFVGIADHAERRLADRARVPAHDPSVHARQARQLPADRLHGRASTGRHVVGLARSAPFGEQPIRGDHVSDVAEVAHRRRVGHGDLAGTARPQRGDLPREGRHNERVRLAGADVVERARHHDLDADLGPERQQGVLRYELGGAVE